MRMGFAYLVHSASKWLRAQYPVIQKVDFSLLTLYIGKRVDKILNSRRLLRVLQGIVLDYGFEYKGTWVVISLTKQSIH